MEVAGTVLKELLSTKGNMVPTSAPEELRTPTIASTSACFCLSVVLVSGRSSISVGSISLATEEQEKRNIPKSPLGI